MEITKYQYILIVPPATSSISANIREHGKEPRKIKRKEMKELVFQSVLNGMTMMLDGERNVKRLTVLNDDDVECLKQIMNFKD